MRSGTLNVPGIVGFGAAAEVAQNDMEKETERLLHLKKLLIDGIRSQLADVTINGSETHVLPGTVNMSFAYVEGESLLMGINGIAVSSGSACTSASLEPSYVLKALGLGDEDSCPFIHPIWVGAFFNGRRCKNCGRTPGFCGNSSTRTQPIVGDGPGRHRLRHRAVVCTLIWEDEDGIFRQSSRALQQSEERKEASTRVPERWNRCGGCTRMRCNEAADPGE